MRRNRWPAWDAAAAISLVLPEIDRFAALINDGPEPLRQPRTALGLCHAGPIAPLSSAISVRIRLPDGTERDLRAEEVTAGTWTAHHPETGDVYAFSSAATPPRG